MVLLTTHSAVQSLYIYTGPNPHPGVVVRFRAASERRIIPLSMSFEKLEKLLERAFGGKERDDSSLITQVESGKGGVFVPDKIAINELCAMLLCEGDNTKRTSFKPGALRALRAAVASLTKPSARFEAYTFLLDCVSQQLELCATEDISTAEDNSIRRQQKWEDFCLAFHDVATDSWSAVRKLSVQAADALLTAPQRMEQHTPCFIDTLRGHVLDAYTIQTDKHTETLVKSWQARDGLMSLLAALGRADVGVIESESAERLRSVAVNGLYDEQISVRGAAARLLASLVARNRDTNTDEGGLLGISLATQFADSMRATESSREMEAAILGMRTLYTATMYLPAVTTKMWDAFSGIIVHECLPHAASTIRQEGSELLHVMVQGHGNGEEDEEERMRTLFAMLLFPENDEGKVDIFDTSWEAQEGRLLTLERVLREITCDEQRVASIVSCIDTAVVRKLICLVEHAEASTRFELRRMGRQLSTVLVRQLLIPSLSASSGTSRSENDGDASDFLSLFVQKWAESLQRFGDDHNTEETPKGTMTPMIVSHACTCMHQVCLTLEHVATDSSFPVSALAAAFSHADFMQHIMSHFETESDISESLRGALMEAKIRWTIIVSTRHRAFSYGYSAGERHREPSADDDHTIHAFILAFCSYIEKAHACEIRRSCLRRTHEALVECIEVWRIVDDGDALRLCQTFAILMETDSISIDNKVALSLLTMTSTLIDSAESDSARIDRARCFRCPLLSLTRQHARFYAYSTLRALLKLIEQVTAAVNGSGTQENYCAFVSAMRESIACLVSSFSRNRSRRRPDLPCSASDDDDGSSSDWDASDDDGDDNVGTSELSIVDLLESFMCKSQEFVHAATSDDTPMDTVHVLPVHSSHLSGACE